MMTNSSFTDTSSNSSSGQYTTDGDFLEVQSCISQLSDTPREYSNGQKGREESKLSHSIENNLPEDEWKKVYSTEVKRYYFYNRRTRESAWKLPPNAKLVSSNPASSNSDCDFSSVKSDINKNVMDARNFVRQAAGRSNVVMMSHKNGNVKEYVSNRSMDQELSLSLSLSTIHDNKFDSRNERRNTNYATNIHGLSDLSVSDTLQQSATFNEDWTLAKSLSKSDIIEDECIESGQNSYCMYCGKMMHFSKDLSKHLLYCDKLHNLKSKDRRGLETLHHIYLSNWSKTLSQKSMVACKRSTNPITYDTSTTMSSTLSSEVENTPKRAGASTDQSRSKSSVTLKNSSSYTINSTMSGRSKATLLSRCPFCSKEFPGERLSGHLLNCSERQKARERRENAYLTPERRANRQQFLTSGGRQLPGHPTIDRARKTQ